MGETIINEQNKRKMPGEFELTHIECGYEDNDRNSLKHYYACGGDAVPFGKFKGQVLQFRKGKRILFGKLYVQFDDYGDYIVEDVEDHVWVYDGDPFFKAGVKVGDCVRFSGLAYAYHRKDGTTDFALKECCDIEIIPPYELPDIQEVRRRDTQYFAETLVCETCLYSSQCFGDPCIAPAGWKEERTQQLLSVSMQE